MPRSSLTVALLAGVVLAAGVVGAVELRGPSSGEAVATAARGVERFVEQARGLAATKPIDIHLAGGSEFRRRLRAASKTDSSDVEAATATLVALGLVKPDVDLAAETKALLDADVIGFYDTKTKRLYVRGGKPSPFTRVTLSHELTHALQDQHFGLRQFDKLKDEPATAATALIEGDAVRVEREYARQLTDVEKVDFQLEAGRISNSTADVPQVLEDLLVFPYVAGPPFLDALMQRGGNAAVDAAFADPPTTSEQILHPDRYFDRQGQVNVEPPATAGKVVDKGQLGEYGLQLVLGDAVDDQTAKTAADGWGGDRYVTTRAGRHDHFAAHVTMDTERDAVELEAALRRWATRHPSAVVTRTRSDLTFTLDGPPRSSK